ncbi:helix-turn-helix domain-containing protein [Bacillus sp. JJ722]|uniref:helix-turn-helix domain-containing protein n=1 Tax=Bacillus sp. JJ722 TaxID=3122973 RepID=UPI002FFF08A3
MDCILIKRLRQNKGMSQRDFAKLLGISRSALAQIESGYKQVTSDITAKINHSLPQDYIEKVRDLYCAH